MKYGLALNHSELEKIMKKNSESVSIGLCALVNRIIDYNKVARVADNNYTLSINISAGAANETDVHIKRNGTIIECGVFHSKNRIVSFPRGIGEFEQFERILETLRGQKIVELRVALNQLQ